MDCKNRSEYDANFKYLTKLLEQNLASIFKKLNLHQNLQIYKIYFGYKKKNTKYI